MKFLRRLAACLALAAFVGLFTVEAFHGHKTIVRPNHCSVCDMAHQVPAIAVSKSPDQSILMAVSKVRLAPVHPYLRFVFASHGLSPPAL